ncbi:MAG: alpha-L-fucosidase, partial [Candidatus Margulisbacteria bacterium]|nr:alpha-L-fucosidase [Candidatus Margulisiibacteriota bacterium]
AKLGIFIHWGPYTVPAWAPSGKAVDELIQEGSESLKELPYAEWYLNSLQSGDSPTAIHHRENYGEQYSYDEFGNQFSKDVLSWDPEEWGTLFKSMGAKYVVLTTKHHDGYTLWPSKHPHPRKKGWFSKRDLVDELSVTTRKHGMKFGVYYSGGYDWSFNQRFIKGISGFFSAAPVSKAYQEYISNHFKELIDRYSPDIIWNDISYPGSNAREIFEYYFSKVEQGVVNDRFADMRIINRFAKLNLVAWFIEKVGLWWVRKNNGDLASLAKTNQAYSDFRTVEYSNIPDIQDHKWEATRGLGHSFAYNQAEGESDYMDAEEIVFTLVDTVSKNGNLLLNIGVDSKGNIPSIISSRLNEFAKWMKINSLAIHDTTPWQRPSGRSDEGHKLRFTYKKTDEGEKIYIFIMGCTQSRIFTIHLPEIKTFKRLRALNSEHNEASDTFIKNAKIENDGLCIILNEQGYQWLNQPTSNYAACFEMSL